MFHAPSPHRFFSVLVVNSSPSTDSKLQPFFLSSQPAAPFAYNLKVQGRWEVGFGIAGIIRRGCSGIQESDFANNSVPSDPPRSVFEGGHDEPAAQSAFFKKFEKCRVLGRSLQFQVGQQGVEADDGKRRGLIVVATGV
jgi:hypothetical protein